MNFLNSLLLVAALSIGLGAQAGINGSPATPLPLLVEQRLNNSALNAPIVKLGSQVTQKKVNVMKAIYDVAQLGGSSGTSYVLKDAAGGDAVLPVNAIVTNVLIDVRTGFTISSGAINLSLGLNAHNDLKDATASNLWTGLMAGTPIGTAATAFRVTQVNRTVTISLSGLSNVTAGKLNVYIEYYLGNP